MLASSVVGRDMVNERATIHKLTKELASLIKDKSNSLQRIII